MIYAWLITSAGLVLTAIKWALFPGRRLPRHRVRHLRIRLRLGLHPGKGLATVFELWWRWGRLAAFRRSNRTRPGLTTGAKILAGPSAYSILIGRAHYRHALRLPLDEHAAIFSPPREGKTGWLSKVIMRYPGAVLSTTTKHDMYQLTAAVRAERGPVHVFNPQDVGHVASTFRWNPLDGCADPVLVNRCGAGGVISAVQGSLPPDPKGRRYARSRSVPRRFRARPGRRSRPGCRAAGGSHRKASALSPWPGDRGRRGDAARQRRCRCTGRGGYPGRAGGGGHAAVGGAVQRAR